MSDDDLIADIIEKAHGKMRIAQRGMRGQIMMPQDTVDWWIAKEALSRSSVEIDQLKSVDALIRRLNDWGSTINIELMPSHAEIEISYPSSVYCERGDGQNWRALLFDLAQKVADAANLTLPTKDTPIAWPDDAKRCANCFERSVVNIDSVWHCLNCGVTEKDSQP